MSESPCVPSASDGVQRFFFWELDSSGQGYASARALPSTQTVRGEVVDEKNAPIPEALCTLTSRLLPTGWSHRNDGSQRPV